MLGQQCAWAVLGDFSAPERDDTIHCWGLDRIESVDTSFNDEYEWESDFPDGGTGANVYAFDTGINVNNGDFGGWAINRYNCLSLCAEVGSCTDNDAQGHGIHVAGTAAGHRYGVAKHAIIHGMQVIGSDGGVTIIGVLNAMDEVVSSVERQHHVGHRSEHSDKRLRCHRSVAMADRASRAWLCTQNKPFERPLGNSCWRRCRVHQEVDREWHAW